MKSTQDICDSVIDEMSFLVLFPETWREIKGIVLRAVKEAEQSALEEAAMICRGNADGCPALSPERFVCSLMTHLIRDRAREK